jgi:hypothetical protein
MAKSVEETLRELVGATLEIEVALSDLREIREGLLVYLGS